MWSVSASVQHHSNAVFVVISDRQCPGFFPDLASLCRWKFLYCLLIWIKCSSFISQRNHVLNTMLLWYTYIANYLSLDVSLPRLYVSDSNVINFKPYPSHKLSSLPPVPLGGARSLLNVLQRTSLWLKLCC